MGGSLIVGNILGSTSSAPMLSVDQKSPVVLCARTLGSTVCGVILNAPHRHACITQIIAAGYHGQKAWIVGCVIPKESLNHGAPLSTAPTLLGGLTRV